MKDKQISIKGNVYEVTEDMYVAIIDGVRSILSDTKDYMIFCIEKDGLGLMVEETYTNPDDLVTGIVKYTDEGFIVHSIGRVDEE